MNSFNCFNSLNSLLINVVFRALLDRYLPDLREVARVVSGCAALPKEAAENKKLFTRLWVHEALRQDHTSNLDFYLKLKLCNRVNFFAKLADMLTLYYLYSHVMVKPVLRIASVLQFIRNRKILFSEIFTIV